jgi:putative membrane protein
MSQEKDGEMVTRDDLAEDRTLLANERTFAGWLRTGLATVGIGVGFHVLFQRMEPSWLPRGIATIFLLIGVAVVVGAERRARAVRDRLDAHVVASARAMNLSVITYAMAAAMLALIAAIWLVGLD